MVEKHKEEDSVRIEGTYNFIHRKWPQIGLESKNHTREVAEDMFKAYDHFISKGYSNDDAWKLCKDYVDENVKQGKYSTTNSSSAKFTETPSSGGKGSLFDEDYSSRQRRRPKIEINESRTSGRVSSTKSYQASDRHRHASRHYQTEERQPSDRHREPVSSVRKDFFYAKERKHGNDPYTYTYQSASEASHKETRSPYRTRLQRPLGDPTNYSTRDSHSQDRSHKPYSAYTPFSPPPQNYYGSYIPPRPPPPPPSFPTGGNPPNYLYAVLGVAHSASEGEIRKAYHKLSMKWHPDRVQGADKVTATQRMAEINQAKDVLGDKRKRAFYDRTGCVPGISNA